MTEKQLLVYGVRIRLGMFHKADELANVAVAACRYYGVPGRTFYYWHARWLESDKRLTSLYDLSRIPKSHSRDADEKISSALSFSFGLAWAIKNYCS